MLDHEVLGAPGACVAGEALVPWKWLFAVRAGDSPAVPSILPALTSCLQTWLLSASLRACFPVFVLGALFPGLLCPPDPEWWVQRAPQAWLCPHIPALCPQEPAFGMLAAPLRTPLTRLPAEYHAEAVGIFKLV